MRFREMSHGALFKAGVARLREFCEANATPAPAITAVPKEKWRVNACAYYRPAEGIKICLVECARLAPVENCRAWSWPGHTVDREPYGVVAHELGHHFDRHYSQRKGSYGGNLAIEMRKSTGEAPISGYCDNDYEWFAEMFRMFVTNAYLLEQLRPKTYAALRDRFTPVSSLDWRQELGEDVPARIVQTLRNKGAA